MSRRLLRLDHSFLFAIIPASISSFKVSLRLDHSFLFAIIHAEIKIITKELRLDHSFLFAIIYIIKHNGVMCCGLTTLSYLL